ncbi:Cytochrome P450 71A1 [Dendrobium catenatum]|uniref:Cytochrome P450 71A1 n=1 Tax=Dendrobium catenatum TaxID=906689 RepID=A0A2I0VZL2_9ASPA|nr:Cytochrome P450 71A1 [Dendrobium catenatum]
MATVIIILITLLTILFFFLHRRKTVAATKLPPRPPGLPLLGNLHQLGSLPHQSLNSLSKRYGPLILLQLGVVAPTVVVSSAEIAEQVMKTQDLIFASRPPSSLANHLIYNSMDIAFSPYNDYWRKMKKICIVHLLSSRRVQSYRRVREEEVALLIADIRAASVAAEAVNLSKRLVTLTNDIICRAALGRKYSGETRFREMLNEFVRLLGCFPLADFVPWLGWIDVLTGLDGRARRTSKQLDEFLEQVLEEHLSRRESSNSIDIETDEDCADFVDVLLSIKEEHDGLDKEHIKALILVRIVSPDPTRAAYWVDPTRDGGTTTVFCSTTLRWGNNILGKFGTAAEIQRLDMFAAGTDTTVTALEWAMAELIKHPILMQEVQREIREVAGSKEVIEEEDIDRLTYLKATIKETLRLHVPIALLVPRVAMEDTQLQGYDIPAGTRILINAWAIARDPENWDKPDEFWPERFMNNNIDFRGQHFHLTPFGAGRRACPGIGFAIAVIECTLANLLHHFNWEVPEETKEEVLDMSESPGISIHKKSALLLTAKLRSV